MPEERIGAIAPIIKRNGANLSLSVLDHLEHLRIERATGLVGRATLRFGDFGYSLAAGDQFALGTTIHIAQPGKGDLFHGVVTGINLEQSGGRPPKFVVVVDDAAYKLARGTAVATYLNGTYTQVLQKIAQKHGLRPAIGTSTLTMEYLLQAGTDLAFLNTVADRLGYAWWIDGEATLNVKKLALSAPATTVTMGEELDDLSIRASGLRPTEVSVHGWDPDQQGEVTDKNRPAIAGSSPSFITPFVGGSPGKKLTAAATAVSDTRPLTSGEAKVLAESFYDDWATAAVVAKGSMDVDSAVKPGATIRVKNAGPASGSYLVTEVEHIYDQRGFRTRFTTGSRRPAGLVDTLGPSAPDPGFTMNGLVVGIVTDASDPDHAGRVKLRYTGVDGNIESPWARVVGLGAGNARGAVFHPEVKDEVLVGFEHGDTRRPVVLGGLFSKRNTLPTGSGYVADGKVNIRRIASRKNHVIELADGEAKTEQHILLVTGTAKHRLRLGADRFDIEVADGIPLTIKAGAAKFDISSGGDVTIEGNNVTIKAKAALNLEGASKATLKSNAQTAVQGTQVQVKADAAGSVEASGPLTLKGAVVAIN